MSGNKLKAIPIVMGRRHVSQTMPFLFSMVMTNPPVRCVKTHRGLRMQAGNALARRFCCFVFSTMGIKQRTGSMTNDHRISMTKRELELTWNFSEISVGVTAEKRAKTELCSSLNSCYSMTRSEWCWNCLTLYWNLNRTLMLLPETTISLNHFSLTQCRVETYLLLLDLILRNRHYCC